MSDADFDPDDPVAKALAELKDAEKKSAIRQEMWDMALERRHDEHMAVLGRIAVALENLAGQA